VKNLTTPSAPPRRASRWLDGEAGRRLVIGVPYTWLLVFFLIPFLIVLKLSLVEMETGNPFGTLLSFVDGVITFKVKISNFLFIAQDDLYVLTYLSSLKYAGITTLFCLAIGYPFAYFMARSPAAWRPALLMLVSLPFWTSYLLRVYAWKGLLDDDGVVNNLLLWLHVIDSPIKMMHTAFSMMVGMVYTYLPFMILPLYANLVKMDARLLEAAADLGSTPLRTFWLVTVPLSWSGIIAGSMLVFIPSIGEYVIPELLGGATTLMIGRVLWDEFFRNFDWAMASAVAVSMVGLILLPLAIFNHYQTRVSGEES
jgi:putrescine transport system permease protein